ncbi:MAG: clan AA aspartic protease [Pseudomonadota bacterium]|jgi:clan AA aspartic protease
MGLVYANIELQSARHVDVPGIIVNALVDSGAMTLCIPEHMALQLKLDKLEDREVVLGDGRHISCPFVGPVRVRFENRQTFVGAMVLGDEVLLGAIPMEDMDVLIHPLNQKLMVNPANPNMACIKVKHLSSYQTVNS